MRKIFAFSFIAVLMIAVLTGCSGNDDTVQTCIISDVSYSSESELEAAEQPDTLTLNEPIYASIHFIESPKGSEYTVKWYLDNNEIKVETKVTENDMQDVVVYELEADQAQKGTLKVEVIYGEDILLSKELVIQ